MNTPTASIWPPSHEWFRAPIGSGNAEVESSKEPPQQLGSHSEYQSWRGIDMRLLTVIFSFVCALAIPHLAAQSPPAVVSRPAILGDFLQGRYSNTILGIMLQLPATWQVDDLDESERFSRSLPRRMHLRFGSSEDHLLLSASPVAPDETLDEVFGVSLMGARDGGGFQEASKEIATSIDGCKVFSQKLRRKSKAGNQSGVYRGFFSHGYYVSILHFGPESSEEAREAILSSLHVH